MYAEINASVAIERIRADLRSAVNRALVERQAEGKESTLDVERAALAAVDRWPGRAEYEYVGGGES